MSPLLLVLLAAASASAASLWADAPMAAQPLYPSEFEVCFTGCSKHILYCMDYFCEGKHANDTGCISSCHDFFLVDAARCVCGCKPYIDTAFPAAAMLLGGDLGADAVVAPSDGTALACVQDTHAKSTECNNKCPKDDLVCAKKCLTAQVDGYCSCDDRPSTPPPPPSSSSLAPSPSPTQYPGDFHICFTDCSIDFLYCMDYFCKGDLAGDKACIANCHDFFLVDSARCVCGCSPYIDSATFPPPAKSSSLSAVLEVTTDHNQTALKCVQDTHAVMSTCNAGCGEDQACFKKCWHAGVDGFCTCSASGPEPPPPPPVTPVPSSTIAPPPAVVKNPDDFHICFTGCSMDFLMCMDYYCQGEHANDKACIANCHDFFLVDSARCVCGCNPYIDSAYFPALSKSSFLDGVLEVTTDHNQTALKCVQDTHAVMSACNAGCGKDQACAKKCWHAGVDGFCTCSAPAPPPSPPSPPSPPTPSPPTPSPPTPSTAAPNPPAPTTKAPETTTKASSAGLGVTRLAILVSAILSVFRWSSA